MSRCLSIPLPRNLALEMPDVVEELLSEVQEIAKGRPYTPRWDLLYQPVKLVCPGTGWSAVTGPMGLWRETAAARVRTMPGASLLETFHPDILPAKYCRFTGPWLPDSADLGDEVDLLLILRLHHSTLHFCPGWAGSGGRSSGSHHQNAVPSLWPGGASCALYRHDDQEEQRNIWRLMVQETNEECPVILSSSLIATELN